MRCLYSPTKTTFVSSKKRRVWALDKSTGPRNSLATTSKSTIVRARLTGLLTPCLDTLNKVQKRKKSSALRTSKFCTACNPRWSEYLAFRQAIQVNSHFSTKSSYMEQLSFPSCAISGTPSKPKWLLKVLTPASKVWDCDSPSYKKTTRKQSFSKAL